MATLEAFKSTLPATLTYFTSSIADTALVNTCVVSCGMFRVFAHFAALSDQSSIDALLTELNPILSLRNTSPQLFLYFMKHLLTKRGLLATAHTRSTYMPSATETTCVDECMKVAQALAKRIDKVA